MKEEKKNINRVWFLIISFLVFLIAAFHYSTSVNLHHWHEIYRALFYLPILLAAFRFQLKGGIFAAAGVIIIYFPHVVFQWGGDFLFNFSRFVQMVLYLIIGVVAGFLAKRERQEREKYQQTAIELEKSFKQLKAQSEKIAEIEDQLRTSERLSVLGELAANLAHEVRNPLASIWGVVEIIKENSIQQGVDYQFLDVLVKEVNRLNQVVENYLNFARRPDATYQDYDLFEVSKSVIQLLNYKAKKQNVTLNLDFPETPLLVHADKVQLQQILINLILNSLSAIDKQGSVTIKGDLVEKKTSSHIVLSIIDTGQGIPEDIIEKIFQPFFTTKKDGTGLGLSIVRRIADQNKWRLELKSSPDHGTIITIKFLAGKLNG